MRWHLPVIALVSLPALGGCDLMTGSAAQSWLSELEANAGPTEPLVAPERRAESGDWTNLVTVVREFTPLSNPVADLVQRNGAGPILFLEDEDRNVLRQELRARKATLDAFLERAHSPNLQVPRQDGRTSFAYEELVADLEAIKSTASAALTRAKLRFADGQSDQALSDLRALYQLTEAGINAQGPLVAYDAFVSTQIEVLATVRVAVRRTPLSEAQLRELLTWIPKTPMVDPALSDAAAIELADLIEPDVRRMRPKDAAFALSRLSGTSSADLNGIADANRRSFDPEETVALLRYTYGFLAANARRPWPERRRELSSTLRNLGMKLPYGLGRYGPPTDDYSPDDGLANQFNVLGRALAVRYTVTFSRQRAMSIRRLSDQSVHPIVIAAQLYRLQYGELPSTLDELTTVGLLASVPLDPATGEPFYYSEEAGRVWGAGIDGEVSAKEMQQQDVRQQQSDYVYPLF